MKKHVEFFFKRQLPHYSISIKLCDRVSIFVTNTRRSLQQNFEFVCSRGANLSCGQDIHSVSWGTLYIHDTDTKTQTQDNNLWLDDMSKGVALCKTLYGINVNNLKRAFGKHLHYNNNRNIRLL